jgi:hypothetical protein
MEISVRKFCTVKDRRGDVRINNGSPGDGPSMYSTSVRDTKKIASQQKQTHGWRWPASARAGNC